MKPSIWLLALGVALMGATCQPTNDGDFSTTTTESEISPTITIIETTTTTSTTIPPKSFEDIREATVRILKGFENEQGEIEYTGWGSGGIISNDGLILTNAHVAAPEAPGLERLYYASRGRTTPTRINPDSLLIGIYVAEDQAPDFLYLAETLVVDGWLDLAVLRIVSNADGTPVDNLDLPFLEIGDSDALQGRDEVTVVGYPSVGGSNITTTGGIVAGFDPDAKIDGVTRGWIKVDVLINPGNSGGVAVDDQLRLIGIPTRGGTIPDLRPINLAKPLIERALGGEREIAGSGVVFGTGRQSMELVGWGLDPGEQSCLDKRYETLPSGSKRIIAAFSFDQFTNGEDVVWFWFKNDELFHVSATDVSAGWIRGPSGECHRFPIRFSDGDPLPDGEYLLNVYAGEALNRVASESTILRGTGEETGGDAQEPDTDVRVRAFVEDGDSGAAIAGAGVFILKPGTPVEAWATSPDATLVRSAGKTGADGLVDLSTPLKRGETYPWIVAGPKDAGYRTASGDGFQLAPEATSPWQLSFSLYKRSD